MLITHRWAGDRLREASVPCPGAGDTRWLWERLLHLALVGGCTWSWRADQLTEAVAAIPRCWPDDLPVEISPIPLIPLGVIYWWPEVLPDWSNELADAWGAVWILEGGFAIRSVGYHSWCQAVAWHLDRLDAADESAAPVLFGPMHVGPEGNAYHVYPIISPKKKEDRS